MLMKDYIYKELVKIARAYIDSCTIPDEGKIVEESNNKYSFRDFYRVYWYLLLFVNLNNRDENMFDMKYRHHVVDRISEFKDDMTIYEIAKSLKYSPLEIALAYLKTKYNKNEVKDMMLNPNLIPSEEIRKQVIECLNNDPQSAYRDILSNSEGKSGEYILEQKLIRRNIPFLTEDQLRVLSYTKTPDILFVVPVMIRNPETNEYELVHWIDSKNQFGSPHNYKDHDKQFVSYIDLYGSGAVIYWIDYVDSCEKIEGLIRLNSFPEDIQVLKL